MHIWFGLGGGALLALAGVLLVATVRRSRRIRNTWYRVPAQIVDVRSRFTRHTAFGNPTSDGWQPTFGYIAPDGTNRFHRSSVSISGPGLNPRVGQPVDMWVDPNDFNRVYVKGWSSMGIFALVFGIIGLTGGLILVMLAVILP